jgi:hypothetical protein
MIFFLLVKKFIVCNQKSANVVGLRVMNSAAQYTNVKIPTGGSCMQEGSLLAKRIFSFMASVVLLETELSLSHRVHTEWRLPISGVHPIMHDGKISPGW